MRYGFADADTEFWFIREFSVGGLVLSGDSLSLQDRRERIRVAILQSKRSNCLFADTGLTYAQAYQRCYGRPLELRRSERGKLPDPDSVDEDDEEEEETDDDEAT